MNLDEIPKFDLRQISHEFAARMGDLAEIQWRDLMNQDPLTHLILFFSCDVFLNIIPLKLFIFIWNIMNYFLIVKVGGVGTEFPRGNSFFVELK